jgi:hypothetical protein
MHFDWTVVLNDAVLIVAFLGSILGLNKRFPLLVKAEQFVIEHAPEVVQTVEAIAATPIGAVVKHHLESEVDKVTEQFKKSEIARLALVGLHSFGTTLDGLSDVQKAALAKFVAESTPAEWNVTSEEVYTVLVDVQKAADAFAGLEIVKAANFFTIAQKSALNTQNTGATTQATTDSAATATA